MMVMGNNHKWRVLLTHVLMVLLVVLVLFPFVTIVSTSFTVGNQGADSLIPSGDKFTLEHWYLAFGLEYTRPDGTVMRPPCPVLLWLWNSIKVAAVSAVLILGLATNAAYAFARIPVKGKKQLLTSLLVLQMFPAALALIAFFAIFYSMGRTVPWLGLNCHGALILAYVSGIALHIWTIKGYFDTLPKELDEAAIMDGATRF